MQFVAAYAYLSDRKIETEMIDGNHKTLSKLHLSRDLEKSVF